MTPRALQEVAVEPSGGLLSDGACLGRLLLFSRGKVLLWLGGGLLCCVDRVVR